MFRHGQFHDACMLFFPQNSVPPPPQTSTVGVATSSSSPQRPDNLATDFGTIDDLCDLCVGYGAMPVLGEVISARLSATEPQDEAVNQYTAAALARICIYCEMHRHFNFLYQFQVKILIAGLSDIIFDLLMTFILFVFLPCTLVGISFLLLLSISSPPFFFHVQMHSTWIF